MGIRAVALTVTASILLVVGLLAVGAAAAAAASRLAAMPAAKTPAPPRRKPLRREPLRRTPRPQKLRSRRPRIRRSRLRPPSRLPRQPRHRNPLRRRPTPEPTPTPESTPTPTPEPVPTPAPLVFGKGATSLHEALLGGGGLPVILAVLLSGGEADLNAGAEIVSPDGSSKCCWTPLHVAVTTSDPDVVSMLVDRGADIEARTGDGQTPCQLAANRLAGLPAHFQICPAAGSGSTPPQTATSPTEAGPSREFSVDGATLKGGTALHEAAATAGPADVKDLLDRGADIHAKVDVYFAGPGTGVEPGSGHTGATVLHIAAGFNPDPEVTKLLLDRGIDVDAKTATRLTPLHLAAQNNVPAVADALLKRGAFAGARDHNGNTPCQLFRQNQHFTGGSRLESLCKLLGAAPAPTAGPRAATPNPAASGRPRRRGGRPVLLELHRKRGYAPARCGPGRWAACFHHKEHRGHRGSWVSTQPKKLCALCGEKGSGFLPPRE